MMEESVNCFSIGFSLVVVATGLLGVCSTGCCQKKIDAEKARAISAVEDAVVQTRAECDPVKAELDAAQKEIGTLKTTLAAVQEENTKLKQTPRYYYDLALAEMAASETDDGDIKAIAAFQHIIDRFPGDPLIAEAQKKIKELQGRIDGRAKALAKAQSEVRRLISICQSNSRTAAGIHHRGLRFNAYNQMDMNLALDSAERAAVYEKRSTEAKEKAEELLKTVPDPDGSLMEKLRRCDLEE